MTETRLEERRREVEAERLGLELDLLKSEKDEREDGVSFMKRERQQCLKANEQEVIRRNIEACITIVKGFQPSSLVAFGIEQTTGEANQLIKDVTTKLTALVAKLEA